MGRRYYCDFCDKSFSDNPTSRRRHFQGVSHQRNRKNHYDSFRAQIQLEERMKQMSYMHGATGEEILRSWLAKRPDIVERCKQHGIQVDVAEGELSYQPSNSYFHPHAATSHNSYLHVAKHTPSCAAPHPYTGATAIASNTLQATCLLWHRTQPAVNLGHSPPLLQPLSQAPQAPFRSIVSPVAAHHMHTHSTHPLQSQHPAPPLVQSQHPAPPLVQSQHPAPPLVQSQHPAPPLVQSQHPAPPLVQSQHPAPHLMQSQHPAPHVMQSRHPAPHLMQSRHPAPHLMQSQHDTLRPSSGLSAPPHHPHNHYKHLL